jgi:hypothetical protein
MNTNVIIGTLICAVLFIGTAAGTTDNSQFDAVVKYCHDHPSYGMVTISQHEDFTGHLDILAYKIKDFDHVRIIDPSASIPKFIIN